MADAEQKRQEKSERPADPVDWWKYYYEKGFAHELHKFREIVAQGETNPRRVIHLFQAWEDTQLRAFDRDRDDFVYTPRDFAREGPLLPTGRPVFVDGLLTGQETRFPYYEKREVAKFIVDYIEHTGFRPEAIVELGSGWGRMLFDVYYYGCPREIVLYSAEASANARAITELLLSLDPAIPVRARPFDFHAPDLALLEGHRRVLFFTHMSVMFVREIRRQVFEEMLRPVPEVQCIHFEPFGFQLAAQPYPASALQRNVADVRGYNVNLVQVLQDLHNEGRLRITTVFKDIFYDRDKGNELSVAVWENAPSR